MKRFFIFVAMLLMCQNVYGFGQEGDYGMPFFNDGDSFNPLDTGAQSGVADKATGDRLSAAEFTAVKNTADTADALATVNAAAILVLQAFDTSISTESGLETVLSTSMASELEAQGYVTTHESTYNHGDIATSIQVDGSSQFAALSADTPVDADIFAFEKGVAGGLVRITWANLKTAIGPTGGWETTVGDLQYSTTPTVANNTLYSCATNWNGQSQLTITDFLGPSTDGNRIGIFYDADEAKTDFSNNANIEGNSNVDFEGSDSQGVLVIYTLNNGVWYADLHGGWSTPTTLVLSSVAAAVNVVTDADGIVLTSDQMNSVIVMTGAGDVDIPTDMCDTATGQWLTVKSTAAHLNSLTSNDATDQFILVDGTALTAANELDLAGTAGAQVTVVCMQANKWWVTGQIGTCVDGGAAD